MKNQVPYQPTDSDIERLKPKLNALKVSGDGIFATLQGEGVTAGKPVVFLRLHFCNLTCGKPTGWKCDTGYTWDKDISEYWHEPSDLTIEDAVIIIEKTWKDKHKSAKKRLVISGGEPLLQQKKIVELIKQLPEWDIEIETNGTITPLEELSNHQFNCSPKLENSGNLLSRRYKPDALKAINKLHNSWFKFVAMKLSDLEEVEKIVSDCKLDPKKIMIMPEGKRLKQVQKHAEILSKTILEKGWKITMRNQLVWFGTKRRT